jgi:hypothetical protein
MTSRIRPKLQRQSTRGSTRASVAIEGRCSFGGREAQDVLVTDLDESGCRMRAAAIGVIKSEPVVLWVSQVGPISGRLKWTKGGALGVAFDAPLGDELLAALREASHLSNVVPLRR